MAKMPDFVDFAAMLSDVQKVFNSYEQQLTNNNNKNNNQLSSPPISPKITSQRKAESKADIVSRAAQRVQHGRILD